MGRPITPATTEMMMIIAVGFTSFVVFYMRKTTMFIMNSTKEMKTKVMKSMKYR